jgi:hypothetical protein
LIDLSDFQKEDFPQLDKDLVSTVHVGFQSRTRTALDFLQGQRDYFSRTHDLSIKMGRIELGANYLPEKLPNLKRALKQYKAEK